MNTFTIAKGEKFWHVYENDIARTSFLSQEDAEYWCTINDIEYTVE